MLLAPSKPPTPLPPLPPPEKRKNMVFWFYLNASGNHVWWSDKSVHYFLNLVRSYPLWQKCWKTTGRTVKSSWFDPICEPTFRKFLFDFVFLLNFRQLSVERDTLRNSLERESAKSKRLSLENEELQWRLVNSTSPPGTPTDEGSPMAKRNSYRLSANYPDVEAIDEWGYLMPQACI